jgi:hypothetical protein
MSISVNISGDAPGKPRDSPGRYLGMSREIPGNAPGMLREIPGNAPGESWEIPGRYRETEKIKKIPRPDGRGAGELRLGRGRRQN